MLLATIPLVNARDRLGALFQQQASQGPGPWTSMGLFRSETVDPALLVLVKDMYHDGSSSRRTSRSRRSSGRRDEFNEEPEGDDWSGALETFVEGLCEQFRRVATPPSPEADNSKSATGRKGPMRLHKGANVVAQYHMRWPDQLDSRWANVPIAPLDLYYIRIEEEGRARTVLPTYRRQMARAQEHDISGGLWIDAYNKRQLRSIDVRITGEGGDLDLTGSRRDRSSRSNEPVPYVIEILSVSIAAPEEEAVSEETKPQPEAG